MGHGCQDNRPYNGDGATAKKDLVTQHDTRCKIVLQGTFKGGQQRGGERNQVVGRHKRMDWPCHVDKP